MKKYKVIVTYSDKYTHEYTPAGTVVTLTDARAKELKGYVELIKEKKEQAK